MNLLYWVRHGENRANITKEFSCKRVDYSLTPKGVLQAQQTASYFVGKDIHQIYSSPLKRALETAEIIASKINLDVIVMENLRETDVGDLENQPPSAETWAIHRKVMRDWFNGKHETSFPGGEDYFTLWGRLQAGLVQILAGKTNQNIIVVGHGGMLYSAIQSLCPEIDLDWLRHAESHNCSITKLGISLQDGQIDAKLITWAAHDHLYGDAANLISGIPQGDDWKK